MPDAKPRIEVPQLCQKHQSLLVHQLGFTPDDPWRALIIMTNIALFQAATARPATHERLGGVIERLPELGCLACYLPDAFGEIVDAVQREGLGAIKPLGEKWVAEGSRA